MILPSATTGGSIFHRSNAERIDALQGSGSSMFDLDQLELLKEEKRDEIAGKRYKLRHKPTGLFYSPASDFRSNYEKKPELTRVGKSYKKIPRIHLFRDREGKVQVFRNEEWETVEVFDAEQL